MSTDLKALEKELIKLTDERRQAESRYRGEERNEYFRQVINPKADQIEATYGMRILWCNESKQYGLFPLCNTRQMFPQ